MSDTGNPFMSFEEVAEKATPEIGLGIELSEDQEQAYETIVEEMLKENQVVTLTGPAGSGKTTLLRKVLARLAAEGIYVELGAPTGKAALRMSQVTGRHAYTMHKLLYARASRDEKDQLVFDDPSPPCLSGDRIALDEASMIGSKLFTEFQEWVPETSSVLYVGDKEQLRPVKDTWGPDLDNATATLTQVHRQALESPILAYATAIRERWGNRWVQEKLDPQDERFQYYGGIESARDWLLHHREQSNDATLITYTHKTRQWLNDAVRESLGLADAPISVGDRLCVKANHKHTGLRNGELVTVSSVEFEDDFALVTLDEWDVEPLYIKLSHIEKGASEHFNWKREFYNKRRGQWAIARRTLHVHYGQCLTVHSSQGSQWDHVGFVWDDSYTNLRRRDVDDGRRLLYTAVTRASEGLAVVTT